MAKISNLHRARTAKKDEFFTPLSNIAEEMSKYREHFKDKVIYCNCDDYEKSNFWLFFKLQFKFLGLKKLIATHYVEDGHSYKTEIVQGDHITHNISDEYIITTPLKGNGDFRSPECVELLKEADIVVTNPPFSLFREFVTLLMEHDKKFLIMGNINAVTYRAVFPYIQNNELWLGHTVNKNMYFLVPDDFEYRASYKGEKEIDGEKVCQVSGITWFTNLETKKRTEKLLLWKPYAGNEVDYPKYDNYDAINVDKVSDIPTDYEGEIGVPITFLDKFCPEQFEILGIDMILTKTHNGKPTEFFINGKKKYARIVIRRK